MRKRKLQRQQAEALYFVASSLAKDAPPEDVERIVDRASGRKIDVLWREEKP